MSKKPCVGTVKKFFYDRNYGFIEADGLPTDLFFHLKDRRACVMTNSEVTLVKDRGLDDRVPKKGDTIIFDIKFTEAGRRKAGAWAFQNELVAAASGK